MAKARIAVIGAGLIGRKHIDVLRTGRAEYELAAVCDPAPAAAAEGQQLGYTVYRTLDEMLDRAKPDGAIVAVPNQMHVATGLACIERGVPIIVEKPIADSVAEAMRLVEAGEKAGVPIMVGHHRRHNPIMRKAAEIVRSGELGTLVAVNGVWMSRKPEDYFDITWRREAGGGPVLINAIHDVDCLRMLCGDVESVQAVTGSDVRRFPVEDTAAAVLRFANGVLGTLVVSDTAATPWSWETTSRENPFYPVEPQNAFMIAGTRGCLAVPSLELRWYDGKQDWGLPLNLRRVPFQPADPYCEQMRNFAAVIAGTEEPAVSGRTGAMTLATTLAITEAARRQAAVRVADMFAA